jgi:hypothetical protein
MFLYRVNPLDSFPSARASRRQTAPAGQGEKTEDSWDGTRRGRCRPASDPVLRAIRDFSLPGRSGSLCGFVMLSYAGRSALVELVRLSCGVSQALVWEDA